MHPQQSEPADAARVLVIDDEPALPATLARSLASEGFLVGVANDGAEGLALARESRPAVVILDLHMPVLDGFGFLEGFRATAGCADIPVILTTGAQNLPAVRQRLASSG